MSDEDYDNGKFLRLVSGVKTVIERRRFLKKRKSITRLQARFRGRRVRRQISSQMVEPMAPLEESSYTSEEDGERWDESRSQKSSRDGRRQEISELTKAVQVISLQMLSMREELQEMKRSHANALEQATNAILSSPVRQYRAWEDREEGEGEEGEELYQEEQVEDGRDWDWEEGVEEEGQDREDEESERQGWDAHEEQEEEIRQKLSLSAANRIRRRMQERMQQPPQASSENQQGWRKRGARDRERLYDSEQEKRIVEQTILQARARRLAREATEQEIDEYGGQRYRKE